VLDVVYHKYSKGLLEKEAIDPFYHECTQLQHIKDILFFHCSQYHQVPQDVPKAPQGLSDMVCPKFNSHWKVGLYKSLFVELFCNWESKEVLLLGSTQYSQKIDDGPINIAPSQKKYSCEHTHVFNIPITDL